MIGTAKRLAYRSRLVLVALPLVAALALPSTALGATVSGTYWISGYEYYATSTEGRFAGTASGSSGDSAAWNAVVEHSPVTDTAVITGGYAELLTSNFVRLYGTFSGGSLALVDEAPGCGTQTYSVAGTLKHVTRSDRPGKGKGSFTATLTHYRTSLLGGCIVYSASVTGTIVLSSN